MNNKLDKYAIIDIKFPIKDFGLALNYLQDSYGSNIWIPTSTIQRIIDTNLIQTLLDTEHLKLGKNYYLFTN